MAETTVQALRHDVSTMKDVLLSRITTTEEVLEELQTTHEKLTSELHATKTAIMHKLMEELERFATKSHLETELSKAAHTLRPTASEFVPSHHYSRSPGSLPEASTTGGGVVLHLQKPPPFDGRFSWDAYKLQFEMLADLNHWSDAEKAAYLAVSLRGSALTVLTNVPPDHRGEYATLIAALNKRFGSAHQADLNRAKLKGRLRKRDGSLPELAEDVVRLTCLAYPDASAEMLEILSKDQFIDAFTDEDFRLRLRQNKPETLRHALEQALELESIQLANKQHTRMVREVQLEPHYTSPPVNRVSFKEALQTLQSILDVVQQTSPTKPQGEQQSPRNRAQGSGKKIHCWNCKEGHIQQQWPDRTTARRGGAPTEQKHDAGRSTNTNVQSGNGQ